MRQIYLGLFLCFFCTTAFSQNERFKSLFVYNFAKNIEWSADYQQGDFIITVLGSSPMYSELQQNVKGKRSGTQSIQVKQASNISSIQKCNILYIPFQQSNLISAARKQLGGKPTLIVSEKNGMMNNGSDINIIQVDGKFQFEINPKQISEKKMQVTQALLKLGIIYESGTVRKTPELESVNDASVPR